MEPQKNRSSCNYMKTIDFKLKTVKRDKQGNYIIPAGSMQQAYTIINIYVPSSRGPIYIKQILIDLKGKIDCNIIIVRNLTLHL